MNIRKHIPNALTCISLATGCYACILALCGDYRGAMIAICIASVLDFSDGLAARMLNAYSAIGKDLDSLADLVSFGVAPGMIVFDFIDRTQKTAAWGNPLWEGKVLLITAFLIPVFSALRLAKFNNDKRQTTSFIGLPVPANALFWAPLIYTLDAVLRGNPQNTCIIPVAVSCLAVISSFLLVSEIPMFSLKVKSLAWKGNELRYILFISAIGFILWLGPLGITVTVAAYVVLSIFNKRK